MSTPDGPHIVAVEYDVLHDSVWVRTSPYSVLGSHGRDTTLALEAEYLDPTLDVGWSVVARGRGEVVTDPAQLEALEALEARRGRRRPAAASRERALVLRVRWTELFGRRITTREEFEAITHDDGPEHWPG